MKAPRFRCIALTLASLSLVNALLLAAVHHHRPSYRHHAGPVHAACGDHEIRHVGCASQHTQSANPSRKPRPSDPRDGCPVCHFLSQQPLQTHIGSVGGAPLNLGRVASFEAVCPCLSRPAIYQGRAPPV